MHPVRIDRLHMIRHYTISQKETGSHYPFHNPLKKQPKVSKETKKNEWITIKILSTVQTDQK